MRRSDPRWLLAAAAAVGASCTPGPEPVDLQPYPNPFGEGDPGWAPQPRRENPTEVLVGDGFAWVSLQGSVDEPGHLVARVDLDSGEVRRAEVGSSPTGLALHPDGRRLVVFNRFSNRASIVDTERVREVGLIPTDFYATEGVFEPDGRALWVTSRWHDTVERWALDDDLRRVGRPVSVPVGSNPRDVAISADGDTVAVAALTGTTVSLVDVRRREERVRIDVGAPPNGLVFAGDWLVVATLSRSTHHLPLAGPDTDGDGTPGDGTPNVNFQDLQDELAVYRVDTGEERWRYTSDTLCCRDYRDVFPEDVARHGDLLPPSDTWIVGGALPEQLAAAGDQVVVTYSGSDQWQVFDLDPATGALTPGPVWSSGHNPHGVAVDGDRVVIAHRLGETLGIYDLSTGAPLAAPIVGDVDGGAFPATDAEIGELVNHVTGPLTVDGDQACAMCHREGGNIDKAFSMPLTRQPGRGLRMTMAYRGMADTRPWFFESAMDDTNFKPVLNEFARIENFCCSDYTLFPGGIPADCEADPPPECSQPGPGSLDGFAASRDAPYAPARPTAFVTRDLFVRDGMTRLAGRDTSFGDGLYLEDPVTGARSPVPLGFDGITRALGLFLLQEPRLLPNPNPVTAQSRRGEALFNRPDVGCATCHPPPTYAVSLEVNPFGLPLRMGPVVTPNRADDGTNLDLLATGFVEAFPQAEMDTCEELCGEAACATDPSVCDDLREVRLGVPSLRGVWDRAPGMLHDGRARSLREVICTPGHPGLLPGEIGYDERDGVIDTHGATSHLTADEIADLVAFLLTL